MSFAGIPTAENHKYLGAYIGNTNKFLETCRAKKAIYTRTNMLIKQNSAAIGCSDKIKKIYLNAYGGVYGIEYFDEIETPISRAHRYLTQTLWPKSKNFKSEDGFLHNWALYQQAAAGADSIYVVHRKLRNKFILKSRKSDNPLIRDICGRLSVIDGSSFIRSLPTNRIYESKAVWASAAFMKKISFDLFS